MKRKDVCKVCGKILKLNFKIVNVDGINVKKPFVTQCCEQKSTGRYCIGGRQ